MMMMILGQCNTEVRSMPLSPVFLTSFALCRKPFALLGLKLYGKRCIAVA